MPPVHRLLSLGAALSLAAGCQGPKGGGEPQGGGLWGDAFDLGDEDGGGGWDAGDEGGPEGRPHPYATYEGWEIYEYNAGPGDCRLLWHVVGAPAQTIPEGCVGCEFLFEVSLRYDADVSYDDGACVDKATDWTFVFAYTEADGAGSALIGVGSSFVPRADAEFDGETFRYTFGGEGYLQDGLTYTQYSYGTATIR